VARRSAAGYPRPMSTEASTYPLRTWGRPAGLALALALAAAPLPAQEGVPNLSGVWRFNPQRSDDVREKIFDATGGDYTQGGSKAEVVRVFIHNWLMGAVEHPDEVRLTIEQNEKTFKSGIGDEISIYYFGREATSRGPAGGNLKVTVRAEGGQVITQEKQEKGGGEIDAVYSMLPGGKGLVLAWRLEHSSLRKPLEVHMVFDKGTAAP
jgi:hypothetical protein